jgi:hypothetical protein
MNATLQAGDACLKDHNTTIGYEAGAMNATLQAGDACLNDAT